MLCFLLPPLSARAADAQEELADALRLEELEEEERALGLDRYGDLEGGYDAGSFLRDLLLSGLKAVVSASLWKELGAVGLVLLLCAIGRAAVPSQEGSFDAVTLAGAAAVTALLTGGQESLLAQTEETLQRLRDLSNVFLPVLSSAALLSGQVTGAAAKYAAAALFLNVLINLCSGFILPLIRLYAAGAAAEAAVGGGLLSGVLGFLRWCAVTAMTCLMLAFTLYLSLTALTANSADAAVVRSAKTAVSTLLPVVGSIAGDAAASILAAAGVIRQTLGGFGLLAVSALLLSPFLRAGIRALLLKGISTVASELTDSRLGTLLKRLGEAMGLLVGAIGSCALLLFFSVYAFLGTVTL